MSKHVPLTRVALPDFLKDVISLQTFSADADKGNMNGQKELGTKENYTCQQAVLEPLHKEPVQTMVFRQIRLTNNCFMLERATSVRSQLLFYNSISDLDLPAS